MNFFERQAAMRSVSRRWVVLFLLAVGAIVAAVDLVVVAVVAAYRRQSQDAYDAQGLIASAGHFGGVLLWTSLIVLGVIVISSLYKSSALRAGGGAVAAAAGGVRINRDSTDAAYRRLLNVVEEMAIASGVPMPEVYVLEHERSINAFAAGYAPANAAIAVTRGALDTLTRGELQGVIAHEFSHVLNGDMRLNSRLIGLLFGILVIAIVGRFVLRVAPRGGGRKSSGVLAAIVLAALAIMAIGYIGLFFGRLIQAAVARSRESLADASAVQFTRDPHGLRGALVKIGASEFGSELAESQADEIAHMLFAPGLKSWLATHPPLVERIRAIDPSFRESEFATARKQLATAEANVSEPSVRDTSPPKAAAQVAKLTNLVGAPTTAHVIAAHALLNSFPEPILQAANSVDAARGLFFALALDTDQEVRERQLRFIGTQLGQNVASEVERWLEQARALPIDQRQPALLRLFPALRRLSEAERTQLLICLTGLLQREARASAIDKYALRKLAQVHLRESLSAPRLPGRMTLDAAAENLALLFGVLAKAGSDEPSQARLAYEAGMSVLLPRTRPSFPADASIDARLDGALTQLDRLMPAAKELLVEALQKTIAHDGKLTVQEAELLRAVCASVHCPLPPLLRSS